MKFNFDKYYGTQSLMSLLVKLKIKSTNFHNGTIMIDFANKLYLDK